MFKDKTYSCIKTINKFLTFLPFDFCSFVEMDLFDKGSILILSTFIDDDGLVSESVIPLFTAITGTESGNNVMH